MSDTTNTPSDHSGSNTRAIMVLAIFVIGFVPVVFGLTLLANEVVYKPLCGSGVVGVEQFSPSISTGHQQASCTYSDGSKRDLADVIGGGAALGWSLLVNLVRFGTPFLATGILIGLLPPLAQRRESIEEQMYG